MGTVVPTCGYLYCQHYQHASSASSLLPHCCPSISADWALIPTTIRTEVAKRLALAGALRSMDEIIRFIARHGTAQAVHNVRGSDDAAVCAFVCTYACMLARGHMGMCTCLCERSRLGPWLWGTMTCHSSNGLSPLRHAAQA